VFSFPFFDDMIDLRTEVEDLFRLCAVPGLDPAVRGLFIFQIDELSKTEIIRDVNSVWNSLR